MVYNFEQQLKEVIISCSDAVELEKINDDTDLVKDFGFNSVNLIQLIVELETVFDIEIDDEDLQVDKLSTYKGLLQILKEKNVAM